MKYVKRLLFAGLIALIISSTSICGKSNMVTIEWYGHSCFLLTLENDYKILTDPFSTEWVPYQPPSGNVNVIFSSHDHFDHNAVDIVPSDYVLRASGTEATFFGTKKGKPFEGQGDFSFDLGGMELTCTTIPSFHDERQGELRGPNGIIRFNVADIVFVHLGDLGHTLESEMEEEIGDVSVLFVPVGGGSTIDSAKAAEIVRSLSPRIVIPMHYKTPAITRELETVENFLKRAGGKEIVPQPRLNVNKNNLPLNTELVVLNYPGA